MKYEIVDGVLGHRDPDGVIRPSPETHFVCQWCGGPGVGLEQAHGSKRYCRPSHRQYAYLARRAARLGLPASPTGYVRLRAIRAARGRATGPETYTNGGSWPDPR